MSTNILNILGSLRPYWPLDPSADFVLRGLLRPRDSRLLWVRFCRIFLSFRIRFQNCFQNFHCRFDTSRSLTALRSRDIGSYTRYLPSVNSKTRTDRQTRTKKMYSSSWIENVWPKYSLGEGVSFLDGVTLIRFKVSFLGRFNLLDKWQV